MRTIVVPDSGGDRDTFFRLSYTQGLAAHLEGERQGALKRLINTCGMSQDPLVVKAFAEYDAIAKFVDFLRKPKEEEQDDIG